MKAASHSPKPSPNSVSMSISCWISSALLRASSSTALFLALDNSSFLTASALLRWTSCSAPDVLASLEGLRRLFPGGMGCGVLREVGCMGSSGLVFGGCAGVGVAVLSTLADMLLVAFVLVRIEIPGCSADGRPGRSVLGLLDSECTTLFLFTEGLV